MKIPTVLVFALILLACCPINAELLAEYKGDSFFDGFDFFTDNDPTDGYVNYVDRPQATNQGLIQVNGYGQVKMKADSTSIASGRGRNSVRIESKKIYNSGLFIADFEHIPTGCGQWPAYWLYGPNWPNSREIDILEYVNNMDVNQGTLHTNAGCNMDGVDKSSFTGDWAKDLSGDKDATNCDVKAPGQDTNQGCGITAIKGSCGTGFNAIGGGVYAANWNPSTGIKLWLFPRGHIPADIKSGNPNIEAWGKPFANFDFGPNCSNSHIVNQKLTINLTFCGQWAGRDFAKMCPGKGNCVDYVRESFWEFNEAYWLINYVKVYSPQ